MLEITEKQGSPLHYFTLDGEYGSAQGLILIDTSNWTKAQWDALEDSHPADRLTIAKKFAKQNRGSSLGVEQG
jgi:hypothetical protein